MTEPEPVDTGNYQMVASHGSEVVVMLPRPRMTRAEALVHAAWLVVMADIDDEFLAVLSAVRNT